MEDGKFVSIKVEKKGANGDIHKVDGYLEAPLLQMVLVI